MALQNYAIEPMKTFLDGQYSIPNYQREYSWEENEIQDFLNDLEDTCANPSTIHFFGQIVVHNDAAHNYIHDFCALSSAFVRKSIFYHSISSCIKKGSSIVQLCRRIL